MESVYVLLQNLRTLTIEGEERGFLQESIFYFCPRMPAVLHFNRLRGGRGGKQTKRNTAQLEEDFRDVRIVNW